jgi:aldose 1-epimerase
MAPEIATIHDPNSGSSAEILVARLQLLSLLGQLDGPAIEVIYAPADFAAGQGRPSRGGIPLLFPFLGAFRGRRLRGKENSISSNRRCLRQRDHGFALSRPWRAIEQSPNRVVGQFHAWRDDPSLKTRWPADFRLTATYSLADNVLRGEFLIENPCELPLPCGFGTHPYFRLPLGGRNADDCAVRLPVSARWELQEMLPTGAASGSAQRDSFSDRPTLCRPEAGRCLCGAGLRWRLVLGLDSRSGQRRHTHTTVRQRLSRMRGLYAAAPRGDLHRALHVRRRRV